MRNYLRAALLFGGLLFMACGEGSTTDRDCRNDGVGCTPGFECQLNADAAYECLRPGDGAGGSGGSGGTAGAGASGGEGGVGGSGATDGSGGTGGVGGGEFVVPPRDPTLDVELSQLEIPLDDPTDPRTVSIVLGIRRTASMDANSIQIWMGPSFNVPDGEVTEAYNIYSPDDPNYALADLVEPVSVTVESSEDDAPAAPDGRGRPFEKHIITLATPAPLTDGTRYFVRAIGGRRTTTDPALHHRDKWDGYPLTGGRNAGTFVHGLEVGDNPVTPELIDAVMGLRAFTVVGPNHVRLELGGGAAPDALDAPGNFTIASADDPNYAGGVQPVAVGRRSYPEVFAPGYGYPFPRKLNRHEVYLHLATPLTEGSTYVFSLAQGTTNGRSTLTAPYSDDTTRNHHLKINQVGYRPDAPVKMGLLGAWMGTLGTLTYGEGERTCVVVNVATGDEVFTGPLTFRHASDAADEGPYQNNFTEEDLHACDFAAVQAPGEYYLKVAGMGRSYSFTISEDVYLRPFQVAMRGIFYQRSGQSLDETNSAYRRVASHLDPVEIPYMDDRPIRGGHYDAGDYNPRSHYDVVHILMLLYEMFPQKFSDSQLDVPERGNGVPDVLDEAMWGLRALLELQDADGGVGYDEATDNFIESKSDPNFVEVAERDPWKQLSYEKHPKGTLIVAAVAAAASRLWANLGKAARAAELLDAAVRAYEWAKGNGAEAHGDSYAWAAAELSRTTRERKYFDDFNATGYTITGAFDDGNMNRLRAAFVFATDTHDDADATTRSQMHTAINNVAATLSRPCASYAYPHFQHPYAPVSWGTAAYPHKIETMVGMWLLSGDAEFLRYMTHSADFSLGSNPLNQSWTTGLGDRPVYGPAHLFGWHTFLGIMPPGLQVEGPNKDADYIKRFMNQNIPPPEETPSYYNYYDVRYSIGLNEGVVPNQAWTAFLYGALLPDLP